MKVAVVGQGYVGLPLAIAAANAGHEVVGVDINDALVARLNAGESPIGDIASASITAVLDSSYSVTTDFGVIRDCSVVVLCVPIRCGRGPHAFHCPCITLPKSTT